MMSAYDRWKTTPPAVLARPGECLNCCGDHWVRDAGDELVCGDCRMPAITYRYEMCDCGAITAATCRCDEFSGRW